MIWCGHMCNKDILDSLHLQLDAFITQCGLLTPNDVMDLGQHWLRKWFVAWWHHSITPNQYWLVTKGPVAFAWEQFHKKCTWTESVSLVWRLHHDDVIKWKHFPRCWPFVRGIHRSPVNAPHKGQQSFDVFFDLRLNKRLSKQPWGWWFETPPCSFWRHYLGAVSVLIPVSKRGTILVIWCRVKGACFLDSIFAIGGFEYIIVV